MIINTDNQASIQAIGDPRKYSGQLFVIVAIEWINYLRKEGFAIELHWIPAYMGIDGNEMADKEAKEAIGWRQRRRYGQRVEIDTNEIAAQSPNSKRIISIVKIAIKVYAF